MGNLNSIYQKNLKSLEEKYPLYAEKLQKVESDTTDIYILEDTIESNKTIKVKKSNDYFYVHSKYYPLFEAGEWIDRNLKDQNEIHIFFGFGLGYYILELIKKIPLTNPIFIFEPDIKLFKIALENYDLVELINRNNLLLSIEDTKDLNQQLQLILDYNLLEKITVYNLPNYGALYFDEYKEFHNKVRDIFSKSVTNRNTVNYFSKMWQENFIRNILYLFDSCLFTEFEEKLKDIPVIIVASGPSLNKNISKLKDVKGRAIIVCVGRALKLLLSEGIKPDIVAALDGEDICSQQFDGLDYSDIILLYTIRVHPGVLERHFGNKIMIPYCEGYIEAVLQKMGVSYKNISCGGSVATMAFSFARLSGANPIVFVGQDLAYSGSETHAKGTYYNNENDVVIREELLYKVKGINGEELNTGNDLYIFLKWFEEGISNDKTGRLYINATEGGANIQGTKISTLSKVIEEYCKDEMQVGPVLENVFANKHKYDDNMIIEYIKSLDEIPLRIDEIVVKCKKAIKLNEELNNIYKLNLRKDVSRIIKSLDEIDKYLISKREEFGLLFNILQPVYDSVLSKKKLPEDSTEKEKGLFVSEMGRDFYSKVQKEMVNSKPLIEDLIKNLRIKYHLKDGGTSNG